MAHPEPPYPHGSAQAPQLLWAPTTTFLLSQDLEEGSPGDPKLLLPFLTLLLMPHVSPDPKPSVGHHLHPSRLPHFIVRHVPSSLCCWFTPFLAVDCSVGTTLEFSASFEKSRPVL